LTISKIDRKSNNIDELIQILKYLHYDGTVTYTNRETMEQLTQKA